MLIVITLGVISPIAGAVASLFFFILLLRKGDIQNLFLLFYLVLFFSDSRSGLFEFAKIIKPALALIFGLIGLNYGIKRKLFPNWVKFFIPFFAWSLVLIAFSPVPLVSFQKTLSYILLYLSVPVFFLFLLKNVGTTFIKNYFFIILLLLLFGLISKMIYPDFVTLSERYRGLLGNPNGLGIFLAVQFLFFQVVKSKWPMLFSKTELRWLYLIFIISLLLSQSRAAMGVFIIFFILSWIYKRSVFLGVIFSIALVFFGNFIASYIPELIVNAGLGEFMRIETLEEGSGRGVAWTFAWLQIQDQYFVGKGFAYTAYIFGKYSEMLSLMGHQGNAHNSYLTFWLNTGLVGLVLYFFGLLRVIIKSAKTNNIAVPVFTGFLISANFESWLTASLNPFTIVFIMTITLLLYEPEGVTQVSGMTNVN
jgi:O-antigen ligase